MRRLDVIGLADTFPSERTSRRDCLTMSDQGSVTRWISDLRAGDPLVAAQLWNRYHSQLVALARKKLGPSPRRASDEEDVVIDAFDSFFRGAGQGRFPRLDDRDDLWQVLVMITARKAINQRSHEMRAKRGGGDVRGDSVFRDAEQEHSPGLDVVQSGEPTPEFAAAVAEEFGRLLDQLGDETLRRVAVGKMEGNTNEELATQLGCKLRTIERKLHLIRSLWSTESNP